MKPTPDAGVRQVLLLLPPCVAKGVDGDHRQEILGFVRERTLLNGAQHIFARSRDTTDRRHWGRVCGGPLARGVDGERKRHGYTPRFPWRSWARNSSGVLVAL